MRTLLLPASLIAVLLAGTLLGREPVAPESLPFACWASRAAELQSDLRALPRDPDLSAAEVRARIDGLITAGERVDPVHARLVAEVRNLVVMEAALAGPVLDLHAAIRRLDLRGPAGREVGEAFLLVHAVRWAAPPSPGARARALERVLRLRREPGTASYAASMERFLP